MRGAKLVLLALLALAGPAWGSGMPVVVTQPWLALLAAFIGGSNVEVRLLQEWNPEGDLVRAGRGQNGLPRDARVMALDVDEALRTGLKAGDYPNLQALYDRFPIEGASLDASMSDPAVLPFVAQRVLTVLSGWAPSNYPYYQRRLAEFQARLSGSVLAGRQVLHGTPVYDLTGASGALLQAAGCRVERPAAEQLASWSKGDFAGLPEVLAAKQEAKAVIVADGGTARPLRKFLSGKPGVFFFARPALDQDYPSFLHDQYISLWQRITAKPPQRKAQGRPPGRRR